MKKLLHERLKEWSHKDNITSIIREYEGVGNNGLLLNRWAKEIERYYIPRPRFEDGEPIQFGDEFIIDRYMLKPEKLTRLAIYSKELLEEFEQYHGVAPVYEMNFCRPGCDDGKEPIIKRPSPKVLDTDGVEIKVGDTVWSKGEAEYIVEEIKDEDHIHLRRPYEDKALVKMTARCLTHKEPDSLEKLRDDMHKEWLIGFEIGKEKARDWSDRLSAIIEKVD